MSAGVSRRKNSGTRGKEHCNEAKEMAQLGTLEKKILFCFTILLKACATSWKQMRMLREEDPLCWQHSERRESCPGSKTKAGKILAARCRAWGSSGHVFCGLIPWWIDSVSATLKNKTKFKYVKFELYFPLQLFFLF